MAQPEIFGLVESDFDNLLIHQKNNILDLINRGKLIDARAALEIVREMWFSCQYEYKYNEIDQRIRINTLPYIDD